MDYDMEFTIMFKDEEVERIKANFSEGIVEYENIISEYPYRQFSEAPDIVKLYDWLKDRCYPRNRDNIKDLLRNIGLTHYDPKKIVRVTNGVKWEDFRRIKFKGGELTWDDVKVRD